MCRQFLQTQVFVDAFVANYGGVHMFTISSVANSCSQRPAAVRKKRNVIATEFFKLHLSGVTLFFYIAPMTIEDSQQLHCYGLWWLLCKAQVEDTV